MAKIRSKMNNLSADHCEAPSDAEQLYIYNHSLPCPPNFSESEPGFMNMRTEQIRDRDLHSLRGNEEPSLNSDAAIGRSNVLSSNRSEPGFNNMRVDQSPETDMNSLRENEEPSGLNSNAAARRSNIQPRQQRRVHKQTQTVFTNEELQIMQAELDCMKRQNKQLLEKINTTFFWMALMVGTIALITMVPWSYKGQEIDHHELRVMLVGKTGAGKSASGNTILGEEAFRVEASPASVTPGCEKKNKAVDGRNVTIIDTPGVMDTWLMSDQAAQDAPECISMIVPGPHAFLLVVRVGRFTVEEVNAVKWIQENFGEVAVKFTMILFTGGDLLEGKPIQKFISNSYELQNLVNTCSGRYHVFNNYKPHDRTQVSELLQKIKLMLHENMGYMYTNEVYKKVKQTNQEEDTRKQKQMKEVAVKLRDEQYENIKLKAEMDQAHGTIGKLQIAIFGLGVLCVILMLVCHRIYT